MATDHLQEDIELTPEAFSDLQKRLAKLEKKLEKANTRAQATMQEIWQLDVKLKEEEERANQAERRLAELQGEGEPVADQAAALADLQDEIEILRDELRRAREEAEEAASQSATVAELQDEIELLRDELKRAREEAAGVEGLRADLAAARDQLSEVATGAELVREAEERAHRLAEERDQLAARMVELEEKLGQLGAAADSAAEVESALQAAQDRITELEEQLAAATSESSDSGAELAAELQAAQDRIAELESSLSEGGASHESPDVSRLEWLEARLGGLRIALEQAEARARQVESEHSIGATGTGEFEEQLEAIQHKVKEAEERALEWEERFHRSQEEATGSEEFEELRRELSQAQDRLSEMEAQGVAGAPGVTIEAYQRLEKELEEFQAELEDANRRAEEAVAKLQELQDLSADEEVQQYKERLELSEERSRLLQEKAQQAAENLQLSATRLDDVRAEKERLHEELGRARTDLEQLQRKLEEATAQASAAAAGGGISLAGGGDSRLQEALKRARDAELKCNQSEIQLQRAMESLKEYEQRANESDRETQRLAFQDGLTGLPNLNLIRQYLDFTVKQVQRYNRASALLVVDLDRFKLINDAMGFKAGDELLGKVAERLQTAIRESDALGRKGEDEFLILLSELITGDDDAPAEQKTNMIRQNIAIVVNRISECLSRPFTIQGQKFYIRASIGVSICPNDADSAQAMLEHADSAMYHAKESGRGRCIFYNNELHKRQERRLTMDSQLRLAMEKGEFVLLYQPIIEVTKGKGQVVGVEALLRWNHRIDGLLEPASFLSIAEETGLIVQLGQWVCRQSCWQLRQWLSQGHNLFVSFNVSTRQMLQADLAEMILGSVDEFGLQPGLIFVELSEGSNVEEVDLAERVIANLGRAGIKVAIDDFGVGYSSISRIDLNHIQFLKIDPSLVSVCQQDRAKSNICEAAVKLAQSLELLAIAEGVENVNQARFLTKAGCRFLQGYHISRPVTPEEITNMLSEKRAWKF